MPDELRKTRLAGDGKDAMSGGGIPLPDTFRAVLRQLLVKGMSTHPEVAKALAETKTLQLNDKRIFTIWGGWDGLAADVLAELEERNLVRQVETFFASGMWELTERFIPGTRHVVMSSPDVRVSVMTEEDEARVNLLEDAVLTVTRLQTALRNKEYLTPESEAAFTALAEALSPDRPRAARAPAGTEKRPVGRPSSAVKHFTVEPADTPEVMQECVKCHDPKPLTREYYSCEWSRRGWYWRTDCKACIKADRERKDADREAAIKAAILSLAAEGAELTVDLVAFRSGYSDRRRAIMYWRRLYANREVDVKCPEKPYRINDPRRKTPKDG